MMHDSPTPSPAAPGARLAIKELNPVYYQTEEQLKRHSAALGKVCACEPCKLFIAWSAAERRAAKAEAQATAMTHQAIYGEGLLQAAERRVAELEAERDDWKRIVDQNLDAHEQSEFELCTRLAAAARENERLRKRLEDYSPYVNHWSTCRTGPDRTGRCTCGLAETVYAAYALAAEPREGE